MTTKSRPMACECGRQPVYREEHGARHGIACLYCNIAVYHNSRDEVHGFWDGIQLQRRKRIQGAPADTQEAGKSMIATHRHIQTGRLYGRDTHGFWMYLDGIAWVTSICITHKGDSAWLEPLEASQ